MNEQFINDVVANIMEKVAANRVTKEILKGNVSLPAQGELLNKNMHPASRLNMTSAGGNGFADSVAGVPAVATKKYPMHIDGMPDDFMQGTYTDFKNPKFSQGTVKNMQNMPAMVNHAISAGAFTPANHGNSMDALKGHFDTYKSGNDGNSSSTADRTNANTASGFSNKGGDVLGSQEHLQTRKDNLWRVKRFGGVNKPGLINSVNDNSNFSLGQ